MLDPNPSPTFAQLLQQFFMERLIQQRNASPRTVAAYRDTMRLLLQFTEQRLHRRPERLELSDIDAPLVLQFLDHLEAARHNSIRSRNLRLAAIRSFLRYAASRVPESLGTIQQVLAIPMKRYERPLVRFLSREEICALLDAPNPNTWCGQRDRVMLATLYNTGARVSELIGIRVGDVELDRSPSVRLHGKGRKERAVPLWRSTANQIRLWLRQIDASHGQWLFPNRSGGPMTRTGITDRLNLAYEAAATHCVGLKGRRISPHLVRHATAMHLLQAGVDLTVIALWLGHENPATTHMYIEADLAMKERALSTLQLPHSRQHRYRPTDRVLQFLEGL
ncbi:site-specific integrase [Paraburkholderia mimosarum]|uniref:site-specific integrase n=2 Tax=Paraburkholderia TaxID=1822464 RepID=UPI000481D9E3|nr:site-specific integrase [Paraburkholderia mimosarum]